MATITRAKTGKTEQQKESLSEFKARMRKKVEKQALERKAKSIRSKGGSAGVETIGGKDVLVVVKPAEIVAERKDTGERLTQTDVNILKNKQALAQRQYNTLLEQQKADRERLSKVQSYETIGGFVTPTFTQKVKMEADIIKREQAIKKALSEAKIPEINFLIKKQLEEQERQNKLRQRLDVLSKNLSAQQTILGLNPEIASQIRVEESLTKPITQAPTLLNSYRLDLINKNKILNTLPISSEFKKRLITDEKKILANKLLGNVNKESLSTIDEFLTKAKSLGLKDKKSLANYLNILSTSKIIKSDINKFTKKVYDKRNKIADKLGMKAEAFLTTARDISNNPEKYYKISPANAKKDLENASAVPIALYGIGYLLKAEEKLLRVPVEQAYKLFSNTVTSTSDLILKFKDPNIRKRLIEDLLRKGQNVQSKLILLEKQLDKLPLSSITVLGGFVKNPKQAYENIKEKLKQVIEYSKKQISQAPTVQKFSKVIVNDILPFTNSSSRNAILKIADKKVPNKEEIGSLAFDIIGIFSGLSATRIGNKVTSLLKAKKSLKVFNSVKSLSSISKIATWDFAVSVLRDVEVAKRVYNASKSVYNVELNYLDKVAKDLGLKNSKELLNNYNGVLANEFKEDISLRKYAKTFFGITTANKTQLSRGQKNFIKLLGSKYSREQINRILNNLENYRKSQVIGSIAGLTNLEISSDLLAGKLIKAGLGKQKAISIAVLREGVSSILVESNLQGIKYTPAEMFLGVAYGVPYSLWASKGGLKTVKVKSEDVNKYIQNLSENVVKKLPTSKLTKYSIKLVTKVNKETSTKATPSQIKLLVARLNNKEKKELAKEYVKASILNNRKRIKLPPKFEKVQKASIKDPIVNFLDPYEFLGDVMQDLGESFGKKINKYSDKILGFKLWNKGRKVKAKIKTRLKGVKSVSKSKMQTRAKKISKIRAKLKAKVKSQVKTKPKTKVKTRIRPKIKPKSKTKPKTKVKTKPKTKIKPKTKPKTKVKVKPKIRVKVVFTQIPFLELKNLPLQYALFLNTNKGIIKKDVKGGLSKVVNTGVELSSKKGVKGFIIKKVGTLQQKSKGTITKKVNNFNIIRGKDTIRFNKRTK